MKNPPPGKQIVRTCSGNPIAVLFLNKPELAALDRLLDSYLFATEIDDPYLVRLKRIHDGLRKEIGK